MEETKQSEDSVEIVITEQDIKNKLLESNLPEIQENKDEFDIMADSLAEFLSIPINRQFNNIFLDVYARSSNKASAKSNASLE